MTTQGHLTDGDAYRPFVSKRGRLTAILMCVGTVVVFGVVAFLVVPTGGNTGWTMLDKWMMFAFGLMIAAALTRWGAVKAVPSAEGLTVQNLMTKRFVPWAQIVNVQFGGGRPWCLIDLDDTDQLAIMAIQRADGEDAMREAQRLAALVAHHSKVERDN